MRGTYHDIGSLLGDLRIIPVMRGTLLEECYGSINDGIIPVMRGTSQMGREKTRWNGIIPVMRGT